MTSAPSVPSRLPEKEDGVSGRGIDPSEVEFEREWVYDEAASLGEYAWSRYDGRDARRAA